MTQNMNQAANQYANRPKDERFDSIDAFIAHAKEQQDLSEERSYNLKDLHVIVGNTLNTPTFQPTPEQATVKLQSPKGTADFTHWSFGQLCRSLGAPAGYLRTLDPKIAADALNYGLATSTLGTAANLLVKAPNGNPFPVVRACTSETYGRLYDYPLYSVLKSQVLDRGNFTLPPVWGGGVAGAYSGDRDSFLIATNGGSIVTDPTLHSGGDSGAMYRGLLIRNSEVGACSVTIDCILYRYICGNHILWGAVYDQRFRRRHVGKNVLRDTIREISQIAVRWTQAGTERDTAIIRGLIDHEIAHTKEAVIDELRAIDKTLTKEQATAAYELCERTEAVSPRSFWGAAQGLTRLSQESQYQNERFELDRVAALILSRGAKLVAA